MRYNDNMSAGERRNLRRGDARREQRYAFEDAKQSKSLAAARENLLTQLEAEEKRSKGKNKTDLRRSLISAFGGIIQQDMYNRGRKDVQSMKDFADLYEDYLGGGMGMTGGGRSRAGRSSTGKKGDRYKIDFGDEKYMHTPQIKDPETGEMIPDPDAIPEERSRRVGNLFDRDTGRMGTYREGEGIKWSADEGFTSGGGRGTVTAPSWTGDLLAGKTVRPGRGGMMSYGQPEAGESPYAGMFREMLQSQGLMPKKKRGYSPQPWLLQMSSLDPKTGKQRDYDAVTRTWSDRPTGGKPIVTQGMPGGERRNLGSQPQKELIDVTEQTMGFPSKKTTQKGEDTTTYGELNTAKDKEKPGWKESLAGGTPTIAPPAAVSRGQKTANPSMGVRGVSRMITDPLTPVVSAVGGAAGKWGMGEAKGIGGYLGTAGKYYGLDKWARKTSREISDYSYDWYKKGKRGFKKGKRGFKRYGY